MLSIVFSFYSILEEGIAFKQFFSSICDFRRMKTNADSEQKQIQNKSPMKHKYSFLLRNSIHTYKMFYALEILHHSKGYYFSLSLDIIMLRYN